MSAGRVSVGKHIQRLTELLEQALRTRGVEDRCVEAPGLVGRRAAKRLLAAQPLPPFDNSQMDGFAVRSTDLRTSSRGTAALPVADTVAAGAAQRHLPAGHAMAVMTGAPVPDGADLVIPVERSSIGSFDRWATGSRAEEVRFDEAVASELAAGSYIRRAGSDVTVGATLAEEGQTLTPAVLGLLAAQGYSQVPVVERVRALVLSTGEEIRGPTETLQPGQIYDANAALVGAGLETLGCEVKTARVPSDEADRFVTVLSEQLRAHQPQVVFTIGGISMGAYEVVRQVLSEWGIEFGSIAQQPGGPQGWGMVAASYAQTRQPVAVIALPGNPVSCAVTVEAVVRPALAAAGGECLPPQRLRVRTTQSLQSPEGLRQFWRVRFTGEQHGVPEVETVGGPSSHLLGHLARAEALLELLEDDTHVDPGAEREAILLAPWREATGWSAADG